MPKKGLDRTGSCLIAMAMLLMVAGVRFLDANELTPKANYALFPLLLSLVFGFAGLFLWMRAEASQAEPVTSSDKLRKDR